MGMPKDTLHTDWTHGSYEADRNAFIQKLENDTGNLGIHIVAGKGNEKSLTIGYGWDLDKNSAETTLTEFKNAGITLSDEQKTVFDAYKSNSEATFQINGEEVTRIPTQSDMQNIWGSLDINQTQADVLFDNVIEDWEKALSNALGPEHDLPDSKERMVILSLAYNITSPNATSIEAKLEETIKLLKETPETDIEAFKQRANIWWETALNSNSIEQTELEGIQNRRFKEADQFGLKGHSDTPSDARTAAEDKAIQEVFDERKMKTDPTTYLQQRKVPSSRIDEFLEDNFLDSPQLPSSRPDHDDISINPRHVASNEATELNFSLDSQAQEAIAFVDQMDQDYAPELKRDGPASAPSVSPT